MILKNNRDLFKLFLNIKKNKQFQLTKIYSKSIKKSIKTSLIEREFSLHNILIRAKFVFTQNDSIFLIKNSFIFVNGVCITNPNYVLKINDVISMSFFKNYFFFFKTNFNQKLRLTYALGYRL
jgi:ribosomal protein S4